MNRSIQNTKHETHFKDLTPFHFGLAVMLLKASIDVNKYEKKFGKVMSLKSY